jgi:squalene-associated FAD-dependent desaturase
MSSKNVLIIGGGLAGLSSAVALAEAGFRVQLLEKRPHLGGRAASYSLPNGEHVDNCQHVTLGCCTNLDDFYRRVGAADKIRWYDRLVFVGPDGRRGTIEQSPVPPPFHFSPSFTIFPLLRWADKRAIVRAMLSIVRSAGRPPALESGEVSMLEWLRRQRQTAAGIERFWKVVLVSALNESLDRTDARYGVDVFWRAFLANRRGYRVGIPCVPLGQLYDGCRVAIELRGGKVRLRGGVRQICIEEGRVLGISLLDGTEVAADFYLAAVPHDVLPALLPPGVVENEPAFENLRHLRTSPITGVHLWFDRTVMAEPFLTVLERTTQWIFNKSYLSGVGAGAADQEQYLQLVISASYGLVPQSRPAIIDLCRRELADILPATREARLVKATVIKEVDATFSPAPGCDQWRSGPLSSAEGLFLAGDWTATGWPATMESAVRSGYLAAEAICAAAGAPQTFLQPDLAVEGLNHWLART